MSDPAPRIEIVLACFNGRARARELHRRLGETLAADGAKLLDELVFRVTPKGKVRVYDPRRTVVGTWIPALTWGVFGLLTSGPSVTSLLVSAALGAVCGGLWAYFSGHLLTKDERARIGKRLPPDSSAILAFVADVDAGRLAAITASLGPDVASVATIGADLSATVRNGSASGPGGDALLTMLLFRYRGQRTAESVNARANGKSHRNQPAVVTELLIAADGRGSLHVASPGARAFVKSDVVGWAVLGLAFGAVAAIRGGGGLFGDVEKSLVTGIGWALFGLVAGTLYGLGALRAASARRLGALGPLLPPDTSIVLGWAEGALPEAAVAPWSAPGSEQLSLRFNRVARGAVLVA